jgi:predicted metalloprotease
VLGYSGPQPTACGQTIPRNAFYCPNDNSIYFDTSLLTREMGTNGDFGAVFVIAHEWGHLAQQELGILDHPPRFPVEVELQADCFAGAYAKDADARGELRQGDLEAAGKSLFAAGDPAGVAWFDPAAHGTSQQRMDSFDKGYGGGYEACIG